MLSLLLTVFSLSATARDGIKKPLISVEFGVHFYSDVIVCHIHILVQTEIGTLESSL
jgi:hypothetical protein